MNVQKESPVECANTRGAEIAVSLLKENHSMNDTASLTQSAYRAGWESYPFTFHAGKSAAHLWLSGRPALSLADFRENRWRVFTAGRIEIYPGEHAAFDDGFSRALAEHVAGVRHE